MKSRCGLRYFCFNADANAVGATAEEIIMAEIYKTEDGQRFTNQVDAQQHANNLASEATSTP